MDLRPILSRPASWILAAMLLAACGEADRAGVEEGDPVRGGTAVVLTEREPDQLNPITYETAPASQVVHLVFRSLARRDSTLTSYRPDLAAEWALEADSVTVAIRLRDDVHWHDGTPVTANDVAFTIERQRAQAVASPRRGDVAAVAEVEVVDDHNLRITLERPGPYTVNALLEVIPAPRHLMGDAAPDRLRFEPFGRQPVGNGRFRFVGWRDGQSITLEANPDAPEGPPMLDRIVVRFVPDEGAAVSEILAGQADLMKIPAALRERVEQTRGVEVGHAARVRPAWIAWNVDRAPVDDPRVRRAVLMAIDREGLASGLFGEAGEPAWSPLPEGLAESTGGVEPLPYDPEAAGRLLDEAGWRRAAEGELRRNAAGDPLRLEVDYIATDATRRDVLVAVQAMLRRAGIQLAPRAFESTTWVDRLRARDFQGSLWGWGWGPGVVGTNLEMILHSRSIPPGGANFAGYADERTDALIDAALVTFDGEERASIWRELEERMVADAVYAPLYLDPELFAVNERLRGVRLWGIEWWEGAEEWWIPEGRRLPRDRIGPASRQDG
jgi:peptide/nickel transport system substrate-binding protein